MNEPDIFYCNTVSNNHLLYALLAGSLRNSRTILTIHDINCMYDSAPGFSLRSIYRHVGKKMLLKKVKELNVVSKTMVPYLRNRAGKDIPIHCIPGAFSGEFYNPLPIEDKVTLVIPGTIESKRRNYEEAFELLEMAEEMKFPLHLVLLGGVHDKYGKFMLEKAKAFEGRNASVSFYETSLVDQATFDYQLDHSHFILIPSVIETNICGNIPETYGITKSSGNIFDVIKHAKPFIIPARLKIPADLEQACFRYGAASEIILFLQSLLNDPSIYNEWQERVKFSGEAYSPDYIRRQHPSLFTMQVHGTQHRTHS